MFSNVSSNQIPELEVSFIQDDDFDDYGSSFDDDFEEYEDDEVLDEFDEDVSLYDSSFQDDDYDEPYDDHEAEDGYVQFHSDGEELMDEDDIGFDDETDF